jgi:hypothetical protein
MMLKSRLTLMTMVILTFILSACQDATSPPVTSKPIEKPSEKKPEGVKVTPYERPEIKRERVPVVTPKPSTPAQRFEDGRNIPAFKALMQETKQAYQKGQWNHAENTALQAQRLAPQAAETYLYLALLANQKQQFVNAEALAQRGLSYSQSDAMKKQLWLATLKSAQGQKSIVKVQQAQIALKAFN